MKFIYTGRNYSCAVDCEIISKTDTSILVQRSDCSHVETINRNKSRNKFLLLDDGFYPHAPDDIQRAYLAKHTGIKENRVSTQVLGEGA